MSVSTGDIVRVVLDYQEDFDGKYARVFVQGVFPRGASLPELPAGAVRNVVDVFFGHDMRHVSAFRIPLGEDSSSEGERDG